MERRSWLEAVSFVDQQSKRDRKERAQAQGVPSDGGGQSDLDAVGDDSGVLIPVAVPVGVALSQEVIAGRSLPTVRQVIPDGSVRAEVERTSVGLSFS